MNARIAVVLRELYRTERELAHHLLAVSERHRADHDVFHLCRDLAAWSQRHVNELTETARRRGVDLATTGRPRELAAADEDAGMLLLHDLRALFRAASGVSLDWEMLAQAAQATGDDELLRLAQGCHPDTLRQLRWANAKLKEASPQVLSS